MRTLFDAIVIGAGPAGSTAAILLARGGWSVALVEKQRFPRRKVCGECIAAGNLPLLDALGVGAAVAAAAGPPLTRVALMRGERSAVADLPAAVRPPVQAAARSAMPSSPHSATPTAARFGRALGRETLDTLLLEQARSAGALVLQPWSVQGIEGGAGHWHCRMRALDSGATLSLHAPVAIAAHGSWQALSPAFTRERRARAGSDLFAFKANFRDARLDEGMLPVLSFDGGYGGMVVADAGLTTVACCVRRDRLEACRSLSPGQGAGEVLEALLRHDIGGVRAALKSARREGPWLGAGPIDPGIRLCPDDDLYRIGNAAGEAHPIIGEGISMALQSAWLLCAELLAAPDPSAPCQQRIARRYAAQWRGHFAGRLRLAAAFAHLAMRPTLAGPLMALTCTWPGLLTTGAHWGGKARCAIGAQDLAAQALRASAPRHMTSLSASAF
jgi:2-polyprenyl-6-methoxyphenol hydroxylase-like FAD-dependent oxidoreductase